MQNAAPKPFRTGWMRKSMWIACLMPMWSGCSSLTDSECEGWRKITVNPDDTASPHIYRQILEHNEFGKKFCGW